ncbi:MAG: cytochrome C [Alphaproteobacteria bacterium]|nr:MAG: cytochrome C [Alphaproteobacteria bacterium]
MMAADAGCWAPNRSPEPVEGRVKRVARVVRRAHHGGLTAVCLSLSVAMASAGALRAQPPEADAAAKADRRAADKQRRASPGNLVGHGGPIKALAVDAATGRALTGSFDYAMMVWDVAAEEPRRLARLDDHAGAVNAVAFVPGSKLALAAGDDGTVALWDLETGKLAHRFLGHEAKIVGLAVSADGKWAASASWDRTARLWDLAKREPGPVLSGHQGPVNAVAFSADGSRVYSASADGTIGLWSSADGSFQRPLYRHGWGINVLARLPGGERLIFGGLNGSVAVVDGETGTTVMELPAHERPVLALTVLERPGVIATGGGDGVIRVLRSADGSPIEEYRNPYGPVWALAFIADGTALYYGGLDDFATLWRIAPREPFEAIASPFPRRFQVRGQISGQVAEGEIQFARKCSVCHTLLPDGRNRAGPTLHKVFGRKIGTLPGYPYSEALRRLEIVWTPQTLGKLFELGPEIFTPGSKMPLQKMPDAAQRDALIAYLQLATVDPPIDGNGPAGSDSGVQGEKR